MSHGPDVATSWILEGFLDEARKRPIRVPLRRFPFQIGRRTDRDLCLPSQGVSGSHAVLDLQGGRLVVRDLGSRNGTFVNRNRLGDAPVPVDDGDVLHIARLELRVRRQAGVDLDEHTLNTTIEAAGLPAAFYGNARAFRQMLQERDVRVLYQPIVALSTGAPVAWEALARVSAQGLPDRPDELFRVAADLDREVELSALLRDEAMEGAAALPADRPTLFLNTRPAETRDFALLPGLQRLLDRHPGVDVVLEVHETAITDVGRMRAFSAQLAAMGVALAYDDFGAGQARLLELADAPPRYLKFDRSVCAGMDRASPQRRRLVSTLLQITHEFRVIPVAEGIETAAEARACLDLGFVLAQGFHFGRPGPADAAVTPRSPSAR